MSTTIIGGLGPGLGQSVNPFDPTYELQLLKQQNQQKADAANATAAAAYKSHAAELLEENVQQRNTHQPLLTLPPPPHKQVLSADGLSIVDSTELVCDPISVIPPADTGNTGTSFVSNAASFDDQVLAGMQKIIAMLQYMETQIAAIQKKVGA